VRLIELSERERHDQLMEQEHYLGNANAIGQVLRYVAEYEGEWVGALTFCSAALHLKPRDRLLNWSVREVGQRRHLIAQNSRFLILPSTGRWPNLASRILKVVCQRLSDDWEEHFGHPVLLVETFVDPQRFRGTCYQAAVWQALGQTRGYERRGQDFYLDTQHPTSEQADPQAILDLVRGYWGIEIQQHYRRDYTQREDHCHVRNSPSARNLSLMRSMAIFLYERQRWRPGGKRSLPDWQAKNHRNPNPLISLLSTGDH
jgi:hypothetical protein